MIVEVKQHHIELSNPRDRLSCAVACAINEAISGCYKIANSPNGVIAEVVPIEFLHDFEYFTWKCLYNISGVIYETDLPVSVSEFIKIYDNRESYSAHKFPVEPFSFELGGVS